MDTFTTEKNNNTHQILQLGMRNAAERHNFYTNPLHFFRLFFICIFWVNFLWLPMKPVLCEERWDGVVVTQSNFLALQAFKEELIDPKGYLKTWNDSGFGACSGAWAGIKCAHGQVIVIQLPWKGLKGKITDRIGQLEGLRKLSLHNNQISGSIPSSLGLLINLRGVQLFNNRLTGSIPPSLGYCPMLQSLDFSNNLLTGTIPESLGNATKLYWLNISFNSLSGSIPTSLTSLNSLTFISLQHNNLSGSIPNSWGSNLKNGFSRLQNLVLDHNFLTGTIPASLGNLRELREVSLSHNQFSGHIPQSIGNISNLKQLDLSLNNLRGEIPISFDNLQSLNFFNVSHNNLSGPVPTLLARKFNLSSFVGNIQLCGYSPSTRCPSLAPSEVPAAPSEAPKHHHHKKLGTKDIILIVAGVLLVVLIIVCCILLFCLFRKRKTSNAEGGQATARAAAAGRTGKGVPPIGGEVEPGGDAGGKLVHFDGPLAFTADDLLCATAEIMGKSTYGTVYKATLEDGSQAAVKRLREKITKSQRDFESEVSILGRIRHPNLLALRAYYLGPKGEKLLVFDYMPKGSLASFLHAHGPEIRIDWPIRMNIAQGMARGLLYLHSHENIIHGNLTSSNVLLDENTNAKIADFGLSRLMTTAANSNVIATAGALGYRAPELSKLKKANTKTDVYSLGVILLELLTRKPPGEAMNGVDLPQWVASIVKEEWTNEVFDVDLMRDPSTNGDELLNTLKLALHCVDPSPSARPEVQLILQQLEEIRPQISSAISSDEGAIPSASE
ncbi:putative inactive leucine-rich repeat receptor protein kinase IMK2 [Trifolium repens]|nr:putative inactive leucine-rich repeat receptor protein kinase IMK2 [Trifolium repens]